MTSEQKQKIEEMRQQGQSYFEISSTLDISENTIKSYCRRNNLCAKNNSIPKLVKETLTSCNNCGKQLIQGTKGQPKKFCSEECRRKWWKANEGQGEKKAYYKLTCSCCGIEFESYGNKKRKFCGHACYIKNRFEKVRASHDTRAV